MSLKEKLSQLRHGKNDQSFASAWVMACALGARRAEQKGNAILVQIYHEAAGKAIEDTLPEKNNHF